MAKRHIISYYLEVQNQYLEMLDNLKDFKEMAEDGSISEEEYDTYMAEIELLKTNYERISYIIMLLNKPNRKDNQEADLNKAWYSALSGASKEAILDENRDVLVDLKKILGEHKNG